MMQPGENEKTPNFGPNLVHSEFFSYGFYLQAINLCNQFKRKLMN